jgi:C-terminal processing protease CtpA/Prc
MQYAGVRLVKTRTRIPVKTVHTSTDTSNQSSNTINFLLPIKFEVVPELIISDIRPHSPSDKAGLEIGDVVFSINNQNLSSLTLQKATDPFYGADGKQIKMTIERGGVLMKYHFNFKIYCTKKTP